MRDKRIAIVEDQVDIAKSIAQAIEFTDGLQPAGIYPSAEDALANIASDLPDIVLMDIGLPKMDGIECMIRLKHHHPELAFLMFTVFDNDTKLFDALRYGADGYMLKSGTMFDVIRAIQELLAGGAPMSRDIARRVLLSLREPGLKKQKGFAELTDRQNEIVSLIAKGLLNKEIADRLGISEGTVRQHNYQVFKRLQVNNRTEVALKLRELNSEDQDS